MRLVALLASFWTAAAGGDLASIRAERDLERRYWHALEYASGQIQSARKHYQDGRIDAFEAALREVPEAVELCDQTLRATGKNPSKRPKHFKRAELKMRDIMKHLTGLEQEVDFEERGMVTKVKGRVNQIHEELLLDIMGRRKQP